MIDKQNVDYIGIGMIIGAIVGAVIMGYFAASVQPDCSHDYNKGYGDAIQFTLEHQRMYDLNYNYMNIGTNGTLFRSYDPKINVSGCYQNETGQDPSDLVMHIYCKDNL